MAKKPVVKKKAPKVSKKTSASKKPVVKKDAKREAFAKELKSLIPKLDAEGLAFLVKQSRIHIYNMQVDALNKAAVAANKSSAGAKKVTASAPKKEQGTVRIVATSSGSGYYLYYKNSNIVFSGDEMVQMVKIVNGEGSALEIAGRFLNWLERERRDVFGLVPIQDKFDPKLKSIISLIKKNFKLRKKLTNM